MATFPISRRLCRWLTAIGFVAAVSFAIVAWQVAGDLLRPANRRVETPKALPIVASTLPSKSGSNIATWYTPADAARATVVVVHGIRGNRGSMSDRAKMLHDAGYATVLIDMQAHGESPGEYIGLGDVERHDVRAAVEFARNTNPDHRVAVIGCSLGGAATLLATPLEIDAMVLESVYPTITAAIHNRIQQRLGPLELILAPALICQLHPRLGVSPSDLRPIDYIANIGCPVLLAVGELDRYTTVPETERLYDAAREPKELVIFQGAGHTNLFKYDSRYYEDTVLPFLELHLAAAETQVESSQPLDP